MAPFTLVFLLAFVVLVAVSLIPAVRKELAERRRFNRAMARYARQLELAAGARRPRG